MESLRTWVLLLSGVAVCSAAIDALVPAGQTKQAFRVLSAVVFLYALVTPLRGITPTDIDLDSLLTAQTDDAAALSSRAEDAQILAAQTLLQTQITQTLTDAGYPGCTVRVTCAAFDDGIAPERITVRGEIEEAALEPLLQPYLTTHTAWFLLTED